MSSTYSQKYGHAWCFDVSKHNKDCVDHMMHIHHTLGKRRTIMDQASKIYPSLNFKELSEKLGSEMEKIQLDSQKLQDEYKYSNCTSFR